MALIPCRECGREISTEAPACPHCGAPTAKLSQLSSPNNLATPTNNKSSGLSIKTISGIIAAIVVAFVYCSSKPSNNTKMQATAVTTYNSSSNQSADVQTPPPVIVPADERIFIDTVSRYATNYGAAPNQMAQGAFRPQRAQAICSAMSNGLAVTNWVGTISTMTSNNEGKGVLGVSISNLITVTTWNNDLSDITDNTLILPSSNLLQRVSAMSVGTVVKFSGTFFSSTTDCFEEQSITQNGSMTSPQFTFKFDDVEPYLTALSDTSNAPALASESQPPNLNTSNETKSDSPSTTQKAVFDATNGANTDNSTDQTPSNGAPTSPLVLPPEVVSFDQGHADRLRWENWTASLQGPELQGAVFWSGQRSLANPQTCADGANTTFPNDTESQSIFENGCQEAQDMLRPLDIKRNSDPLYKAGWNSPVTPKCPFENNLNQ